jgi:hypothetical protein
MRSVGQVCINATTHMCASGMIATVYTFPRTLCRHMRTPPACILCNQAVYRGRTVPAARFQGILLTAPDVSSP